MALKDRPSHPPRVAQLGFSRMVSDVYLSHRYSLDHGQLVVYEPFAPFTEVLSEGGHMPGSVLFDQMPAGLGLRRL